MNKQTAVTPYTEQTNKEMACKQQQHQMHVVKIDFQYLVPQQKSTWAYDFLSLLEHMFTK